MLCALPRLGSATAVVLDKAGLCSRLPYSGPPLCSPGGNSLLRGRTAQGETRKTSAHDEKQNLNKMSSRSFTSHMCPTIGASAQECSALMPIFPFGYEIRVKDLSNHLQGEKKQGVFFGCTTARCCVPHRITGLPVVTFPMEQGFGVTVQGAGLCGVITLRLIIKCQEEGGRLDGVQGDFVHTLAEKLQASPSPWNSARAKG